MEEPNKQNIASNLALVSSNITSWSSFGLAADIYKSAPCGVS